MKLRDIEVQNDDFERQARNTSGSLEDLESKLNASIERGVMMEEEIKIGEQERENLRIETQRLRDELSDLKIEAEVMQDKLARSTARLPTPALTAELLGPATPGLEHGSPRSTASSPMINTPAGTKSLSTVDSVSETPTPPSPPFSETSTKAHDILSMQPPPRPTTHMLHDEVSSHFAKAKSLINASRPLPRSRPNTNLAAIAHTPLLYAKEPTLTNASHLRGLPNSTSLSHIRSLTAQMQRLEQRVQSARSKLPAPSNSPRASPSDTGHKQRIPSSITMRMRKRPGSAVATSSTASHTEESVTEEASDSSHVPKLSNTGISRLSYGAIPIRDKANDEQSSDAASSNRPQSRVSGTFVRPERPFSRTESTDRPTSRAEGVRPESQAGRTTPMGHYTQTSTSEQRRPPSSTGYFTGHHRASTSITDVNLDDFSNIPFNPRKSRGAPTLTPSRNRQSSSVYREEQLDGGGSGIPTPSGLRRKSGPGFPHTAFKSGVGDRNSIGGRRIASGMPLTSRTVLGEDTKMMGSPIRPSPQRSSAAQRQSIARLSQPRSPIIRQRTEPVTRRKLSEVGESF